MYKLISFCYENVLWQKCWNLSCLQLSVFLTSPQVSWVGSAGNCRSYIDLVHMFILLGPRQKEQWFPGESSCHDGGQKCKRPNQNMHLAWIKILCLDVTYIMSIHNPLVKASHMTKPNNNGVGRQGEKWMGIYSLFIHSNKCFIIRCFTNLSDNTIPLFVCLTLFSPNFKLLLFYKHNLR